MSHYFITSTGTEIGKTLVTAGLAHQYGYKAFKPIISGVTASTMEGSDTHILAEAQGLPLTLETWNTLSPLRYKAPLAPSMAAELEHKPLCYEKLLDLCQHWLNEHSSCLIEGVGGSFVPLVGDKLVADWIKDLNLSCYLVVGSYLGTISHTLATIEAQISRGIKTEKIFMSESAGDRQPDLQRTALEIEKLTNCSVTVIPRIRSNNPWKELPPLQ
ncbi:dethiobiotin synthase [Temperatibacter marinus]|uniref:ATP-dependent dethiobiotin synthetase BioD n=1 Tax=Temperatibacter marinus TaxID=1456591 RepID=A0AA52EJ98_9PROT|nr:dethiobiotin synthase [Temperatibacter marinus]WND03820.1 dethiobiotin synthase [Temperatibacter marinus]